MLDLTINLSDLPSKAPPPSGVAMSEVLATNDNNKPVFSALLSKNVTQLEVSTATLPTVSVGGQVLPVLLQNGDELPPEFAKPVLPATSLALKLADQASAMTSSIDNESVTTLPVITESTQSILPQTAIDERSPVAAMALKLADQASAMTSSIDNESVTTLPVITESTQSILPQIAIDERSPIARQALSVTASQESQIPAMDKGVGHELLTSASVARTRLSINMSLAPNTDESAQDTLEMAELILPKKMVRLEPQLAVASDVAKSTREAASALLQTPAISILSPAEITMPVAALSFASNGVALQSTPALAIATPLHQVANWNESLAERMVWMTANDVTKVEIRLNPGHLGPLEVRIQMQNDQVQISVTTQHASVRENLEAGLPRLREMFANHDIELLSMDISEHSFAEQREAANRSLDESLETTEDYDAAEDATDAMVAMKGDQSNISHHMLDLFV